MQKLIKLTCLLLLVLMVIVAQAQDEFPELLPHHVITVEWDPQGKQYLVGRVDGSIELYENGVLQITIANAHTDWINGASFSPDGSRVVTTSYDNDVRIWDTTTGNLVGEFLDVADVVLTTSWNSSGTSIMVTGYGTENIFISTDISNDLYSIDELIKLGSGYTIEYNQNNTAIAIGHSFADVLIVDAQSKSVVRVLDATPNDDFLDPPYENTLSVTWHPTANIVANGNINGWIHVWDLDSPSDNVPMLSLQANNGATASALIPFEYSVLDIAFSSDGSVIESVSADGTLRSWAFDTGELLSDTNLGEKILSAAFSPDGNTLVYNPYAAEYAPPTVVVLTDAVGNTPFVVQDNLIHYGHSQTLNCQYVIAGEVFDMDGNPVMEDIAVTLDLLELEGDYSEYSYAFPGDNQEYGISGYAAVLVNWEVDYMIWLTRISTGERLSSRAIASKETSVLI